MMRNIRPPTRSDGRSGDQTRLVRSSPLAALLPVFTLAVCARLVPAQGVEPVSLPYVQSFEDGTAGEMRLTHQHTQSVEGRVIDVASLAIHDGALTWTKRESKEAGAGVKDPPVFLAAAARTQHDWVAKSWDASVRFKAQLDYSAATLALHAGSPSPNLGGVGGGEAGYELTLVNSSPQHPPIYELRLLSGRNVLERTLVSEASDRSTGFQPANGKRELTLRLTATPTADGGLRLTGSLDDGRGNSASVTSDRPPGSAPRLGEWAGFRTASHYNNNGYHVRVDQFQLRRSAADDSVEPQ